MIPEPYNNIAGNIDVIIKTGFERAGNEINYNLSTLQAMYNNVEIVTYINDQRSRINSVLNEIMTNPMTSVYEFRKQIRADQEKMEQMQMAMNNYSNSIEDRQKTLGILDEQLRNVAYELNNRSSAMYKQQAENQAMINKCKESLDTSEKALVKREKTLLSSELVLAKSEQTLAKREHDLFINQQTLLNREEDIAKREQALLKQQEEFDNENLNKKRKI
jgi:chromosome segregation ATPase